MDENVENVKQQFISPTSRYYGEFTPEHLAFNANLQEFANRVSLICGLETGGKITNKEAYNQIKQLWKQLKESKKQLLDSDRPEFDLPDDLLDSP
jgi:sigma54-dependent transcription regulator